MNSVHFIILVFHIHYQWKLNQMLEKKVKWLKYKNVIYEILKYKNLKTDWNPNREAGEKKSKSKKRIKTSSGSKRKLPLGTSLVVRRLRIHLPLQGTQAQSLAGELRSHTPQDNKVRELHWLTPHSGAPES